MPEKIARGKVLQAIREEKMREAFEGKKFVIDSEIHYGPDERFETPFGNKGRHGFILRNVETGERLVVGESVLRRISEQFKAVDIPEKKRKRRTKAQKAADEAAKTSS